MDVACTLVKLLVTHSWQILSTAETLIICRIQPRLKFFQNAM